MRPTEVEANETKMNGKAWQNSEATTLAETYDLRETQGQLR